MTVASRIATRYSAIAAVGVPILLLSAPVLADEWPSELGTVLSWTPPEVNGDPADCTSHVAGDGEGEFRTVQDAVDAAVPGDVICVHSIARQNERIHVAHSGDEGQPIEIRAQGSVVTAGFIVEADDIIIQGFTIDQGERPDQEEWKPGFDLLGERIGIIDNTIFEPSGYGIHCSGQEPSCSDAAFISNTIRGADGHGINAVGRNILIEGNDIAGSVRIHSGDADGIRFFGENILIRQNFIHHIFDRDYPSGEGPHTDCFQTFDSDRPSTRNAVIEDNVCFDVDHQCLMAEARERNEGMDLVFRRNICANNGSQGVLVREFDGVVIEENLFLSTIAYNGVVLRDGVEDATIRCNLIVGRAEIHEIDDTSRDGLAMQDNLHVEGADMAIDAHAEQRESGCQLPGLDPWNAEAAALVALKDHNDD